MIESSIKNTERNISIFLNSNILKKNISISVFIYFYIVILYLNILDIFFLKTSISLIFLTSIAKYVLIINLTNKKKLNDFYNTIKYLQKNMLRLLLSYQKLFGLCFKKYFEKNPKTRTSLSK